MYSFKVIKKVKETNCEWRIGRDAAACLERRQTAAADRRASARIAAADLERRLGIDLDRTVAARRPPPRAEDTAVDSPTVDPTPLP